VQGGKLEEARHGEPLAGTALKSLERGGENLRFVAERETDPDLAPVHCEYTTGGG
jgi:hypothetical protein